MVSLNTIKRELVTLGLTKHNIQYLEDLIRIFSERSEKLPNPVPITPDITRIIGDISPTTCMHVWGHPTSGKTVLASYIVNCLDPKFKVLWADSSFQFNPDLVDNKDSVFVFPTVHLEPLIDIVGNYALVIIDDFALINDPQHISKVIGSAKRAGTPLIVLDQQRINIQRGGAPQAMRSKLEVLFDISIKMNKSEKRANYTNYLATVRRHRSKPLLRGKYTIFSITKQGKVITQTEE